MKFYKIIYFSVIIFIIASCKGNPIDPPTQNNYQPLIPLDAGNYWMYQEYGLDSETGSVIDTNIWKFGFIILKLPPQPSTILDSLNYNISICAEDLSPLDDSKFTLYGGRKSVYQNKNGLYYSGIIRNDTLVKTYNDLIFPYPVQKGDSTQGHVFYYSTTGNYANITDEATTQYKCISIDSVYNTPSGDFKCIVYNMVIDDYKPLFRDEVNYFIEPSIGIVGMVHMIYHYKNNKYDYFIKYVLTNYKLKEEPRKWKIYFLFYSL